MLPEQPRVIDPEMASSLARPGGRSGVKQSSGEDIFNPTAQFSAEHPLTTQGP
jgi:hypothetical protein